MLPAFGLKPAHKKETHPDAKPITFTSLLRSKAYRGNVLIYAACSASFFARLTGSPFILHDMGYSPAAIGLSYVPQTIAFWWVAMAVAPRCKNGKANRCCLGCWCCMR